MANKIPDAKIQEMWAAWQERQSIRYVSRKCAVSALTVSRYKKSEKWSQRLAGIKRQTAEKSDNRQAAFNARAVKIAKKCVEIFEQTLTGEVDCPNCRAKVEVPKAKIDAAAFERMVRLISFLTGGADSRTEEVPVRESFTTAQLLPLLSQETKIALLQAIRTLKRKSDERMKNELA